MRPCLSWDAPAPHSSSWEQLLPPHCPCMDLPGTGMPGKIPVLLFRSKLDLAAAAELQGSPFQCRNSHSGEVYWVGVLAVLCGQWEGQGEPKVSTAGL